MGIDIARTENVKQPACEELDLVSVIQELKARQQIRDTILRFCRGIDHGDKALARSAYHSDAYDEHGFFNGLGVDFVEVGLTATENLETLSHIVCNEYVEFDDLNRTVAYVETTLISCLIENNSDGRMIITAGCRYLDRFECRNGDWRIAHRKVVLDWELHEKAAAHTDNNFSVGMARGCRTVEDPSYTLGFRRWRKDQAAE